MDRRGAAPLLLLLLLQVLTSAAGRGDAGPLSAFSENGEAPPSPAAALLPLPIFVAAASSSNKIKTPANKYRDFVQGERNSKYDFNNPLMGNYLDGKRTSQDDRENLRALDIIADYLVRSPFPYSPSSSAAPGKRDGGGPSDAQLWGAGSGRLQNRRTADESSTLDDAKLGHSVKFKDDSQTLTKEDEYELPSLDKYQSTEEEKPYDGRSKSAKSTTVEKPRPEVGLPLTLLDLNTYGITAPHNKRWLLRRWWKGTKNPNAANISRSFYKRQLNLGNRLMCQLDVRNC